MKLCLRIAVLLFLVTGTLTQELSLEDGLDEIKTTTQKPKEKPKAPEQPKKDGELDLWDAFGPDEPQPEKPKKPSPGDSDSNGFNLGDAVNPGPTTKPDKPAVNPPKGGGGGGKFDDSDLFDVSDGDYKPDGGRSGGRAMGPQGGADQPQGGADQPQGSGPIAGIISAVGVALVGAASSYFAYQKKKLCFKLQGGADPESGKGHQGTHSEPQVLSNLLQTN
ncbi:CD99 molecule isoform X1 [Pundamilia nyererei]|uniref:CD99 antigen-like n=1 Tax=Pundamilia nyererei TaxID=303518 RepID=A0A3B4GKJ7_9CICH|nr:PREDICTED: CD99 antigen-like isoform X1 [Pundamilia nyererei]